MGVWYSKTKLSTLYIDALKDKVQSISLGWYKQYSQPRCFQSSSCHILNMNEKLSVVIYCCLKPLRVSGLFFSPASLHCLDSHRWFSLEVSHIVEIKWHMGLKSTDALLGWVSKKWLLLTCLICFSMAFLSVCLWFGFLQHGSLRVTTYIPWRLVSRERKQKVNQLRVYSELSQGTWAFSIGQSYHRVFPDQIHIQIDGGSGLCCRKACRV